MALADSNVATVYITVYATPVATDDDYAAAENQELDVTAANGVLANDTTPDGNTLTAVLAANPANGSVTLNADGSFSYVPNAGYYGVDSFTYYDENGPADSNVATVYITVYATPVATDDYYATAENQELDVTAANGVLANDSTPDGNTLTPVLAANPANGSVTLNGDGSFSYIPADGFYGVDSFTYYDENGPADSNVATVYLTVYATPVATDDYYATAENQELDVTAANGVLANDSTPDGNTLTAVLASNPANGSVTLNADGSFSYQPNAGFYGVDSFTYYDENGPADSNVATVYITVYATPVATDDYYATAENQELDVTAANGVLANDSTPDGNTLTAVLAANPANGSVTLNADGSFSYVPNADYYGVDSFTYYDENGPGDSNTATVYITVYATPVATDDYYATAENQELDVTAANGVLANDSTPDGNTLTPVLAANPANGSVTLNPDGSFSYQPNNGYYGVDSFTYYDVNGLAISNTATVYLTVYSTPVANDDYYTDVENQTLTVTAGAVNVEGWTDTSYDALVLYFALFGVPNITNFGSGHDDLDGPLDAYWVDVCYYNWGINCIPVWNTTPDPSAYSEAAALGVTILVSDDLSTLLQEVAQLASTKGGVQANDTNPDGNPMTSVLNTPPANGSVTLNPDGSFSYTPNNGYYGVDSFTYYDENGPAHSNVASVYITVYATPVATDDYYATAENRELDVAAPGVLANDTNADGNPITPVVNSLPSNGTLLYFPGDGSFSYMPNSGYYGVDSFTYYDENGPARFDTATVYITVYATPVATDDSYATAENQELDVTAANGVLANDSTPDGNTLTAVLAANPANGSVTLNPDGSFSYQPNIRLLWHGQLYLL